MKKLVLKSVIVASLAASAVGFGAGSASAETMTQEGCTEWNSTDGCVVRQFCTLNTDTRSYTCVWYDTRTGTMKVGGGTY
jgi:hypothetical protein